MLGFLKSNGTQCRFVAMVSKTPVVAIKVSNPWGASKKTKSGLYKVSRKNGIINANYNKSVRSRIAAATGVELAEVEYTSGETWYSHIPTVDGRSLPVVWHKDEAKRNGNYYLQYFPHKSTSVYVNEAGEIVPDETVKPYLYKESELEDFKPCVIAVNLCNIVELRASGVIMQAEDIDEAEAILSQ